MGLNNQRKQQNNKNKITLWKPKEHCVQFAVVMYEKKKKKRERGLRLKVSLEDATGSSFSTGSARIGANGTFPRPAWAP